MLSQSPFWVCEELQQVDCKEDIVQLPDIPGCQSENFLNRVDGEFEAAFVSLVTEFQNHSELIVSVNEMNEMIVEAERVFGT